MCLAVPAQLIEVDGDAAVASLHGNSLSINVSLIDQPRVGDWVLLHAGFAIQRLEGTDLEETWAILDDLAAAAAEEEGGGS